MKLFLGILIALCSPALILHSYFAGNWYSLLHDYSLGMFFGIVSYTYFVLVLVLGTRIRFLDRIYGQDRLLVFHSYLALLAFIFACLHIFFKRSYVGEYDLQLTLGALAFIIFLIVILLAVFLMVDRLLFPVAIVKACKKFASQKLKIDYSHIKFLHNAAWIASSLAIAHITLAISTQEIFQRSALIIVVGVAGVGRYLYHLFGRRVINRRYQYSISDIQLIHKEITQISCAPKSDNKAIAFNPGQFAYLRVFSDNIGSEEHPFTISSDPAQEDMVFTIKALGNYSSQCSQIKTGSAVEIDGPYGKFTPLNNTRYDNFMFIAGGIGITPFLSILNSWKKQNSQKKITLLWSVQHLNEIVQKELFESLYQEHAGLFSLKIFITREKPKPDQNNPGFYYHRRISASDIKSIFSTDNNSRKEATGIYICGPQPLISFSFATLKSAGIQKKQIHFERFFI